jgi:hypothetical protein
VAVIAPGLSFARKGYSPFGFPHRVCWFGEISPGLNQNRLALIFVLNVVNYKKHCHNFPILSLSLLLNLFLSLFTHSLYLTHSLIARVSSSPMVKSFC